MKHSNEAEAYKIGENLVLAILLTEDGYPEYIYMQPPSNNKQSRKQTTQLKNKNDCETLKNISSAITALGECKLKRFWDFMSPQSEYLIQESKQQEILERMWWKGNPYFLLVGLQTDLSTMEAKVEIVQKAHSWSFCITP